VRLVGCHQYLWLCYLPSCIRLFQRSLNAIAAKLTAGELGSCEHGIAFPWRVGCGIGGGDWRRYSVMLHAFASRVAVPVYIVNPQGAGAHGHGSSSYVDGGDVHDGEHATGGDEGGGGDHGGVWVLGDPVGRICWAVPREQLLAVAPAPPSLTVRWCVGTLCGGCMSGA
jgi:hypothetical protein